MNFTDLPAKYSTLDSSKIVIVPVAFDGTSTWIKGADKGPQAIIDASGNLEYYDIETDSEVYRHGIYTDEFIREKSCPRKLANKVESVVNAHLKNDKFVVLLGGEHSVSIGSIYAHAKYFTDLSILQLDAHSDMRQEYEGSPFNHACVMARAREVCPVVQVGIRSMDIAEREYVDEDNLFLAEKIHNHGEWHDNAINKLSSRVYITVDLDVFDPSAMPSTGTPEPGGLGWYQVLEFLKKVIENREMVGFDVVEHCPNEYDKSSDFLAAKLVYKLLSYQFSK